MRNVKILIEYDGTNYHGWQMQPAGVTIQGVFTETLSRLDDRPVVVHGAGRTDAGAHAQGQVANFLFHRPMTEPELLRALNGNLPPDIRVRAVTYVDPDFHARLSAESKTYRYVFFLGLVVSPFIYRYVYHCIFPLDLDRIRTALPLFKGEHDFSNFAVGSHQRATTVRRVTELVTAHTGEKLEMQITANGFLRAMVRRIAGTLQEVGRGRLSLQAVEGLLHGETSVEAGPSLPAKGLTLVRVDY
ncbi:MAG: tRNA pseudouridine(38-40) synthase TruA [Acidobacteria bacterium]|nr:tRNA pseudouridine(38-40) synthase TruA [Acidobacteriota bacterium]